MAPGVNYMGGGLHQKRKLQCVPLPFLVLALRERLTRHASGLRSRSEADRNQAAHYAAFKQPINVVYGHMPSLAGPAATVRAVMNASLQANKRLQPATRKRSLSTTTDDDDSEVEIVEAPNQLASSLPVAKSSSALAPGKR